jgi:hypothetical protein
MDKPADPATPFGEVYQAFLDDLAGYHSRRSPEFCHVPLLLTGTWRNSRRCQALGEHAGR